MNFEPQKFFIGLVDFFAVWLPGAILTYLLMDMAAPYLPADEEMDKIEGWVLFLFASYLAGHFVFLAGSQLDRLYDRLRKGTRDGQIERLAAGKRRSLPTTRLLGRLILKEDRAVRSVLRLKEAQLGAAAASVNAFQWCKAKLALAHGEALAAVERMEADSKFFRSLCVVLLILAGCQLLGYLRVWFGWPDGLPTLPKAAQPTLVNVVLTLLLLWLAFWRYVERRGKSVSQAYWFLITLCASTDSRGLNEGSTGLTHAGGIVLRRQDGQTQVLLVEASDAPGTYVLPKGHIEVGETPAEAAVREVFEESGLWGRVHEKLDDVAFLARGEAVIARYFLMEYLGRHRWEWRWPHRWLKAPKPAHKPRKFKWVALDHPLVGRLPEESRDLMKGVEKGFRPAPAPPARSPRSSRRRAAGPRDR